MTGHLEASPRTPTPSMMRVRTRTVRFRTLLVLSVVVGVVLGVVAVAGFSVSQPVEVFMSQFGLFIVVPAIVGSTADRRTHAAIGGAVTLVTMCLVYYAPYADSVASYLMSAALWTGISVVSGPVFGAAGHELRRASPRGVLAAALLVGLLLGECLRSVVRGTAQGDIDLLWVSIVFDASAAVGVLALVRTARLARVLLTAIPATVVGYGVTLIVLG